MSTLSQIALAIHSASAFTRRATRRRPKNMTRRVYAVDRFTRRAGRYELSVLAIILYFLFGPRIAFAELFGELLICVVMLGGGGGGRVLRFLRGQLGQLHGRRSAPARA